MKLTAAWSRKGWEKVSCEVLPTQTFNVLICHITGGDSPSEGGHGTKGTSDSEARCQLECVHKYWLDQ